MVLMEITTAGMGLLEEQPVTATACATTASVELTVLSALAGRGLTVLTVIFVSLVK